MGWSLAVIWTVAGVIVFGSCQRLCLAARWLLDAPSRGGDVERPPVSLISRRAERDFNGTDGEYDGQKGR